MTTNAVGIPIDPERAAGILQQEAVQKVNSGEKEVLLDFSAVQRIDTDVVRAMEELAVLADSRSVQLVLRGVNVDIYRVFTLLRLSQRFSYC